MKIGINAMCLERSLTGVGRYTSSLIHGLLDRHIDLELYSYGKLRAVGSSSIVKSSNLDIRSNLFMKLLWDQILVNKIISEDTNIYHSPSFILPFNKIKSVKYIVTVHDFGFLRYPDYYDWRTRLYLKLFINRSLRGADMIICVSSSCQNDLAFYYPGYQNKSVVINNGFSNFGEIFEDAGILGKHKIRNIRYLLTVGNCHPRKNIKTTIDIFNDLNKIYKDIKLVVAGYNEDINNNRFDKIINNENIIFTGAVTDAELAALYKNSYIFLFLSLYEGFGLPILEAMSCGIPVITCNNSSLPEVSGYDKTLLVDDNDSKDAYNKIEELLNNKELYNQLRAHGYQHVSKFSWAKMVDETVATYKYLLRQEQ